MIRETSVRLTRKRNNMKKKKENKIFAIYMAVLAVLAVIFRAFDMKISELLYNKGNFFAGFCENIGAALPFLICSFCFATLIFCRHTRTTRNKNTLLSILCGIASLICSFVTVFYPLRKSSVNYYWLIFAAAVLCAICIFLAATLFKSTYQKILMTKYAKIGILSSLISTAAYLVATLVPQRPSYAAILLSIEKFGNPDSPEATVPFFAMSGVGAAIMIWIVCFAEIFPKLKFSSKYLLAFSIIWSLAMLIGSVIGGNTYGFEVICAIISTNIIMFVVQRFIKKDEKD